MKKYILIIWMSTLFFSCEDFLRLAPEHEINTQNFYQNENDFNTALIGIYATMQSFHNVALHYVGEMATDNAEIQLHNPSAEDLSIEESNITAINGRVSGYWTTAYSIIARSNTILTRIENADINDVTKKNIQGQARFLRAYAYFYLVRWFGDVSIVTTEFTNPSQIAAYDMSRKPVDEVYRLILDDLKEAEKLLSPEVPVERGKASIGAVKTLLAKVYLTRHDYASAATVLEEIMTLKNERGTQAYDLVANYNTLFSVNNDDLIESIFEIEYASGNMGEGNGFADQFYPIIEKMAVFPGNLSAGGRCVPTESLEKAYEPNDKRKDFTIGDQIPLTDGSTVTSRFCRKFVDYNATLLSDGGVNFTVFRYADVLLMYAEVLNELGRPGAENYLNTVRSRAGLGAKTGLDKVGFRLAIEQERRVEFAFEAQRWFDLLRTGRLQTVINNFYQSNGKSFSIADHELLLPIPQSQIDIDPNLTQNTGY